MKFAESAGLAFLHRLDPERAHAMSLLALKYRLAPADGAYSTPRLHTSIAGLNLVNPVGLAAGFDKNAEVITPLLNAGFGFIEVGAATPRAQPGNPKPRLFRLSEDHAAINRFGFNNDGAETIAARLSKRAGSGVVGLNLGANKDSEDRAADYQKVLEICAAHVDFVTVNVSSPNTENLRDLQGAAALSALLGGVIECRDKTKAGLPVFLKIAPDLSDQEIDEIADVAIASRIDAIIATNTTLSRDGLKSLAKDQQGGLSGAPLFAPSTRVLARLAQRCGDAMPLIGVGGIGSAEDAYTKIKAGASAVQLYTAMVYQGISLVSDIAKGLDALLARDGFSNVSEAVGIEKDTYH